MAAAVSMGGVATATAPAGLSSSSLRGQKLSIKPTRASMRRAPARVGAASAKYGEKSIYFDLEDINNTTGNWDLYGSDAPTPYNGLQSKFFETFAGAFARRGLLLKFLLLGGGATIAYAGAKADPNLLAIKKGPQKPPQPGPNGKI